MATPEGWTKTLKPGDLVRVYSYVLGRGYAKSRRPVERVTPAGRVVVDGITYGPNGEERGAGYHWTAGRIEPLT